MAHVSKPRRKPGPDGEGTRQRLVAAALDLFGRKGFEGVGAREIAAAAGTPLGAISHHFGTKEALYRAALELVRQNMGASLAPAVARAQESLEGTIQQAQRAIHELQGAMLEVLAGDPEAESWAKLLLREHLDPTAAFDIVYEDAAKGVLDLLAALLAKASGRQPDAPEVLIEAFACMGEVLVFRVTRHAVIKRLSWSDLGNAERDRIRSALSWM
ncbi:MAG: CerR family C-terminal domain-containing protein [Rhizobiaceae bacterium]|nr:CerR family C-terminal domain-containing protein [Rhizobiaceae bacterium]MCZ8350956.1 CerR family C-terminal domain-containing protein [Rhizobium sp.]